MEERTKMKVLVNNSFSLMLNKATKQISFLKVNVLSFIFYNVFFFSMKAIYVTNKSARIYTVAL